MGIQGYPPKKRGPNNDPKVTMVVNNPLVPFIRPYFLGRWHGGGTRRFSGFSAANWISMFVHIKLAADISELQCVIVDARVYYKQVSTASKVDDQIFLGRFMMLCFQSWFWLHSGNRPWMKMYFLLKMGIFQPAMLVYQRVADFLFLVSYPRYSFGMVDLL